MALDPVELLFGGMGKLGPGSDADTLQALRSLPRQHFDLVVDAGCGAGRQTLALAKALGVTIHAIDSHRPFLDELRRRAEEAGVASQVQPHCMDMSDIPAVFSSIDLLWSEGAAYHIGFANALSRWAPALRPGGFAVVSELAWLSDATPSTARDFFHSGYPDMKLTIENIRIAEETGYRVLGTHTLPREAWTDGYYDVLEPRAMALSGNKDAAVRAFAQETLKEIDVFKSAGDSYGYVFYLLQRP
jgi:cyclopropane fatty-acyl-phospholipid synthase-like methyltransferase